MNKRSANVTGQRRNLFILPVLKNPWMLGGIAIGLVLIGLTAFYGFDYLGKASPTPTADLIYTEPMWAMHSSMHGRMSGMPGEMMSNNTGNDSIPSAEMLERFHDFGTLSGSQQVSHSFVLENHGYADLVVTQAYTTCGCTTAEISASVIPPGKAGLVTVYFNPMQAVGNYAAIRRGIILETNDPKQPQIEIWIQASLGK